MTGDGKRVALILAGGAGTRLWPLSTEERPKQLLKIFGGRSLLQMTVERLSAVCGDQIWIATSRLYEDQIREQLPDLGPARLLLEPSRRNTAPAIASCMATIDAMVPGATVGVFPSDHYIRDEETFAEVARTAFSFASREDYLVTIAIEPTEPATGFGYLQIGSEIEAPVARVSRFIEKPDPDRARELLAEGGYAWNGGMFVWRTEVFRRALAEHAEQIERIAWSLPSAGGEFRSRYDEMPSISIDYALMEKAANVATIRGDFGWSDVGSWSAVARLLEATPSDDVVILESPGAHVMSKSDRPVIVVGCDRVAVIDSPDGLLVLDLNRPDLLSRAVEQLKQRG